MLEAKEISYRYWGQEQPALNKANLHIKAGTIVALAGPNGSGKTTLIKCLAGLLTPMGGKVLREKADIRKIFSHRKNGFATMLPTIPRFERLVKHRSQTGFLSEHYGLYSGITAYQSLEYAVQSRNPENSDPEDVKNRIEQIASEWRIEELLNKETDTLSRGQKQILAIAEVEASSPPLLLLDEPASGLDPRAREHLAERLGEMAKQGRGILVSSHILAELEEYATDLVVMRKGKTFPQQGGFGKGEKEKLREAYRKAERLFEEKQEASQ